MGLLMAAKPCCDAVFKAGSQSCSVALVGPHDTSATWFRRIGSVLLSLAVYSEDFAGSVKDKDCKLRLAGRS